MSNITIDGTEKQAAITDTIEVQENKANVDLGLKDKANYNLSLNKAINKVTVVNSAGTESVEYDATDLARVEINSRNLNGSTVIVEYKISVTNEGDVAGYVKSLIDYKPVDLKFDSSLNKGWYQSEGNLYSTTLSNTKIEPGETKTLTLILTKTMTDSNIGLVNNLAEILEDYNVLGVENKSNAGNKQNSQDDLGSADLIVGIKTGTAVSYIALVISILGFLIAGAYLINIKNIRIPKDNNKIL